MDSLHQMSLLFRTISQVCSSIDISKQFNELIEENKLLKNKLIETNIALESKNAELNELTNKYNNDIQIKNNELKEKTEEFANFTKVSYIQKINEQINEKNKYIIILESQLKKHNESKRMASKMKSTETITNKNILQEDILTESSTKNQTDNVLTESSTKNQTDNVLTESSTKNQTEGKLNEEQKNITELPSKKTSKKNNLTEDSSNTTNNKTIKNTSKTEEIDVNDFEDINGFELIQYKKKYYLRDLETNELYNIVNNQPGVVIGLINSKGRVKFS
jgi:hypothetical protein